MTPSDFGSTPPVGAGGGRAAGPGGAAPSDPRLTLRAGPYWAGVLATAVVAALIGLLGALIGQDVLNLNIVAPTWVPGQSDPGRFAILGALAAVVAGLLMQLLFVATPTPVRFFKWIMGLLTAATAVLPWSTNATLADKVATAVITLVVGVSVISLVTGVTARTIQRSGGRPASPGGANPR